MNSRASGLLTLYQLAAGLSDTSTGLLLLLAPAWTLHLLRVTHPPTPDIFTSFIGAFVLGVGLTYLWLLLRSVRGLATSATWQAQWRDTALIRACVALFLLAAIATSRLEKAWLTVALADAALALVQAIGLQRNWLHLDAKTHRA